MVHHVSHSVVLYCNISCAFSGHLVTQRIFHALLRKLLAHNVVFRLFLAVVLAQNIWWQHLVPLSLIIGPYWFLHKTLLSLCVYIMICSMLSYEQSVIKCTSVLIHHTWEEDLKYCNCFISVSYSCLLLYYWILKFFGPFLQWEYDMSLFLDKV